MDLRSVDHSRGAVARRLAGFDRRVHTVDGRTHAAVAVTVDTAAEDEPSVLVTVRAGHLRAHSGQIALPGGRVEPGEQAVMAALRELDEELGVAVAPDAVLGLLDDFPTRSGYLITPVVVWPDRLPPLRPDPGEVASVHRASFRALDRADVPWFRPTADPARPLIRYPLLDTVVHAPTAAILYQFREVALRGEPTRVDHLEQPRFAWE